MWVDYDVPKWFLTSNNFYRSPFSKWPPQYRFNTRLLLSMGHLIFVKSKSSSSTLTFFCSWDTSSLSNLNLLTSKEKQDMINMWPHYDII
jgi:hypothetical protein